MSAPRLLSARLVLGGLFAAGAAGLGLGVAVGHSGSPTISTVGTAAAASPSPEAGEHHGMGRHGAGFGGAGAVVMALSKETGKTPQAIVSAIQSGQTIDQIAGAKAATVKSDALKALTTQLDKMRTQGVFTQAQEDALVKDASDALDQVMAAHLGKAFPAGMGKAGFGAAGLGFPAD